MNCVLCTFWGPSLKFISYVNCGKRFKYIAIANHSSWVDLWAGKIGYLQKTVPFRLSDWHFQSKLTVLQQFWVMGDSPTGQVPAQPGANPPKPLFGGCWSCRLLTGTGLMLSAGYVFSGARNTMKRGGPTTIGTVFQIVFAAGNTFFLS